MDHPVRLQSPPPPALLNQNTDPAADPAAAGKMVKQNHESDKEGRSSYFDNSSIEWNFRLHPSMRNQALKGQLLTGQAFYFTFSFSSEDKFSIANYRYSFPEKDNSCITRLQMVSNMAAVNFPVCVFCRLG